MNRESTLVLLAYDDWANDRIVEALRGLSDEDYHRQLPGSFPSVRANWSHLVMVEWLWFRRWLGERPAAVPEWEATADLEALIAVLLEVRDLRRAVLAGTTEEELARRVTYPNMAGDFQWTMSGAEVMTHLVNHSTYHRGQITTMLRQLGTKGPATDFSFFIDEGR